MTLKDQAKRAAAGASVALATSGLSSCNDNGAVDPLPPPLQCNSLNAGQTFSASAFRAGDMIEVTIRNLHWSTWQVDTVTNFVGATLVSSTLPPAHTRDPLLLLVRPDSGAARATFLVRATLFGDANEQCVALRVFTLTLSPGGVPISVVEEDELPLSARQRATIVLAQQDGRVVELEARTPYRGAQNISWLVSAGELDIAAGSRVRWTLPQTAGLYQAELVIDYGADGFALDVLTLEVS